MFKQILVLAAMLLSLFATGFSCETCKEHSFKEMIVPADSIVVSDEGLFVDIEGSLFCFFYFIYSGWNCCSNS